MSNIKRRDTNTEKNFRKKIWGKGIKGYRIDVNLPGRPDLYFPKLKIAVFIDGCFWHKCSICFSEPKTNKEYWLPKIEKNIQRDRQNEIELQNLGISVIRFWGHEVKNNLDDISEKFLTIYLDRRSSPNY